MIQAAVGLSTARDTGRAVLEVSRQIDARLDGAAPDWCVAFVTDHHRPCLDRLTEMLGAGLQTPYVVGGSAAGVLVSGREVEDGPALGVLAVRSDQVRATPFLFHDEGDLGMGAGVRLGQRLARSRGREDLVCVWADPFRVRPDRLLAGIDGVLGSVPVVGGACSGAVEEGTFQFCGDDHHHAAVAGLRLGGRFRRAVGVTQGCRPLGRPLRVTRAHEQLILELEGRPASQVLLENLPEGLGDDPRTWEGRVFVGVLPDAESVEAVGDDFLVRNLLSVDPDAGVVSISEWVGEGMYVVLALREGDAARRHLDGMLRRMAGGGAEYAFGLYFNCLARGRSLYGEPGVDARLLQQAFPDVPILGFFGNAEIGPLRGVNRLFTYTGVLALVGE